MESYERDRLVKVIRVCRDVRKNRDTRWSEGFRGSRYGYNEWGNIECFGNLIICCSNSVRFFIV